MKDWQKSLVASWVKQFQKFHGEAATEKRLNRFGGPAAQGMFDCVPQNRLAAVADAFAPDPVFEVETAGTAKLPFKFLKNTPHTFREWLPRALSYKGDFKIPGNASWWYDFYAWQSFTKAYPMDYRFAIFFENENRLIAHGHWRSGTTAAEKAFWSSRISPFCKLGIGMPEKFYRDDSEYMTDEEERFSESPAEYLVLQNRQGQYMRFRGMATPPVPSPREAKRLYGIEL